MGGWGFLVSDCDCVYFTICTPSLCNKDQYYINTNSRWNTAANCYAGGSNGETGAISGVHGWLVENSIPVTVNGGTVSNCTGNAVVTGGAATRFVGTRIMMIDNAGGITLSDRQCHILSDLPNRMDRSLLIPQRMSAGSAVRQADCNGRVRLL